MRAIDADALKTDIVTEGQRSRRYKLGEIWELNRAEIYKVIDEQPTIDPDQLPFIVEPEPCRIPFSTMQRVCKHRRTGGIVYGGDAKPRDACHYEMYRSLWDECSMRNCPILNRREIE